jgi:hypothetical protein
VNKGLYYSVAREYYRWRNKYNSAQVDKFNSGLRARYEFEHTNQASIEKKVYIHNLGAEWYYTSILSTEFKFALTKTPENADLVVFITTIDNAIANKLAGKLVCLFYREPSDYVSHFKNEVSITFLKRNSVFIITHLEGSKIGLSNHIDAKIIQSFFYPHYHHWATSDELKKNVQTPRKLEIFSLTSGLSGIFGNIQRRNFIKMLSNENPNFDLYGRFTKDSYQLKAYRGLCAFKKDLLFKYKYNLVIENTNEDWYISEKIFDALICGCMPIYHGTEKIFDLIPKEWFYYLPTLEAIEMQKLNTFLKTDAHLIVLQNWEKIADFIDKKYSFYRCIEKILAEGIIGIPHETKIEQFHSKI